MNDPYQRLVILIPFLWASVLQGDTGRVLILGNGSLSVSAQHVQEILIEQRIDYRIGRVEDLPSIDREGQPYAVLINDGPENESMVNYGLRHGAGLLALRRSDRGRRDSARRPLGGNRMGRAS